LAAVLETGTGPSAAKIEFWMEISVRPHADYDKIPTGLTVRAVPAGMWVNLYVLGLSPVFVTVKV
jgi:hypothetical protein